MAEPPFQRMKKALSRLRYKKLVWLYNKSVQELEREEELRALEEVEK